MSRRNRKKQNSTSIINAGDDGGPDGARLGHPQLQIYRSEPFCLLCFPRAHLIHGFLLSLEFYNSSSRTKFQDSPHSLYQLASGLLDWSQIRYSSQDRSVLPKEPRQDSWTPHSLRPHSRPNGALRMYPHLLCGAHCNFLANQFLQDSHWRDGPLGLPGHVDIQVPVVPSFLSL